jgi:hypothetical protein
VGSSRRVVGTVAGVAVAAACVLGVSAALAQATDVADGAPAPDAVPTDDLDAEVTPDDQASEPDTGLGDAADHPPVTPAEAELLDRLDALERDLPADLDPSVEVDPARTWADLEGDATGIAAVLGTLEGDLRQLFVDADDVSPPVAGDEHTVASAVALVARGWLDVHQAAITLQAWETNDLAFPLDTTDDDEVATGADQLTGRAEAGLEQLLLGRARQLDGYVALRDLGVSLSDAQARIEDRATSAETFDTDTRPAIAAVLGEPATTVLVPVERFDTSAPGVRARARSSTLRCVDRAAYDALEQPVTDEDVIALAEATPHRADCTDLPASELRGGR